MNPNQTAPLSSTQDAQEDTDCPVGWGWLNPLAIVRIGKCLFVPERSFSDDVMTTTAALAAHYPAGPVLWAVTTVHDVWSAFRDGAQDEPANCDVVVKLPIIDWDMQNSSQNPTWRVWDNCPGSDNGMWESFRGATRLVSRFVILLGMCSGLWRLYGRMIGAGGGEGD